MKRSASAANVNDWGLTAQRFIIRRNPCQKGICCHGICSNTLDTTFCLVALEKALDMGAPGIFNTDQGTQFTSLAFTQALLDKGIKISMDGRGRALDNVFVERLWRTVKYEKFT